MKWWNKIVVLEIQSWTGISVGAEHFYGKMHYGSYGEDEKKVDIEKPMTSSEAKYINEKDEHILFGSRYKKGDPTGRFNSPDEIRKIALKEWKKHFPKAQILTEGSHAVCDPQKVLDAPKTIKPVLDRLYEKAKAIGGYEGNEREMMKISDEWDIFMTRWLEDETPLDELLEGEMIQVKAKIKNKGSDDASAWIEKLDVNSEKTAKQDVENIVERFNNGLRTGELPRELVCIMTEEGSTPSMKHIWRKTNLVTLTKGLSIYDTYSCSACGITGKRYGLSEDIVRDKKYAAKKYSKCGWHLKKKKRCPGTNTNKEI